MNMNLKIIDKYKHVYIAQLYFHMVKSGKFEIYKKLRTCQLQVSLLFQKFEK